MDFIKLWPGKLGKLSEREDEPSPGELPAYHPTAFHMLDVAAVADRILQEEPSRLQAFTTAWSLAEDDARRWIVGLTALHDLGKFSGGFLNQILGRVPEPARTAFFPHYAETRPTSKPHWQLTLPWLRHHRGFLDDYLGPYLLRDRLEEAVAGHHGLPAAPAGSRTARGDPGLAPAKAFLEAWLALIAPTPLKLTEEGELAQPVLSWHLAGLTVMADWIGSNRAWFPFATDWGEPSLWPDLPGYWPIAQERATEALREAGASPAKLSPLSEARTFLGFSTKPLRPLQAALEECRIPNGPTLVLIEDLMGAGKTEAALLISRRLICQGKAEGLHVALPTMATANALARKIHRGWRL